MVETRDGIVVLPFRWPLVDAFHYLPQFGGLLPPARTRLGADIDAALEAATRDGDFLALLFHPFLSEPDERFAVLRGALGASRDSSTPAPCGARRAARWPLAAS